MSVRNLVTLLGVFALVSLGLWAVSLNGHLIDFNVPSFPTRNVQVPAWVVGFVGILIGALGTLLYTVALSSKAAFVRWRRRRSDQRTAEDTELLQAGLVAAVRGDHRGALQRFEKVLEHDPERLSAWTFGGSAARALGNLEKAVEMHMRARGIAPENPDVHDELARDFAALGEYARAVGHLHQRLAADPKGDANLFARLRDLLADQARWDEALEAQEKRIKLIRDPSERADEEAVARGLRLEKGRALLEKGAPEGRQQALATFAALLKEDPEFVPAYLLQARARVAEDDAAGAVETLTAGVAATHSLELLNELVTHYFDAGDPERAIRSFRQAAESIEGDDGRAARLGLALLYARLEMIEEAREELARLEDEVEFSPTVTYHLAKLAARAGDSKTAADRFRQVIQSSSLLEPGYRCRNCGAQHGTYVMHCAECRRWGTVFLETSEELREVADPALRAPRV